MNFSGIVKFGADIKKPWLQFEMDSTAFELFGFEVQWYGVLIGLGMALAMVYAFLHAKKFGIDSDKMIDAAIVGLVLGIIGARIYYVVFAWDQYKGASFREIIDISQGGMAIYGGILFGLGSGALMCKWRKIKVLPMLDLASMGFLIGQALGRWGNFFNQEAFGSNTTLPWGMYSENTRAFLAKLRDVPGINPNAPVHPCFLYESLWCALGFVLLHIFSKKRKYDGQIFLMYVAWYGIGRFFIEGLRTDSLMFGPYRVSRLLAGLLAIAAIVLLVWWRKRESIFGEEGLKAQQEAEKLEAEEKKAKKAEGKKGFSFGKKKEEPVAEEAVEAEEVSEAEETVEEEPTEEGSEEPEKEPEESSAEEPVEENEAETAGEEEK